MGMFSVSAVIMIAGTRGSYALAGAVTATGLAATAVVAPWTARLVDRHGQARIAVPAYAGTATTPNTGGMSRARWAHLLKRDTARLHTANSFEQAADELCFMCGPVLAALLCGALFPEAGTLVAVVLLLTGVLLFTAQRSTEPPARGRTDAGVPSPLRAPGIPPLLIAFLATGAVFGSMEVVTIAFADAQGHRSAAGVVLALQAAGSCAAGLVYGLYGLYGLRGLHGALRTTRAVERRVERRYVLGIAAMVPLVCLPLLAATLGGGLVAVGLALLVAGMATAPTMVTAMTLLQHRTPEGRLNEGMTLAVTGLLGGIACGAALGGWVVEHASAAAGYGVPGVAATTALLIALATASHPSPASLEGRGPSGPSNA
ncbi:transporter [Streptomyces aurantiacus]|uniref:Transporter n=2 Tax=Streptomyces aurantiacus TaxID=47760 RepID=A0A7G1P394_9ACTN|nr:transporter [Streptomyces aurantiacus]